MSASADELAPDEVVVYTPGRLELGGTVCRLVGRSKLGVRVQWPDRSAGSPWAKPGPRRTFSAVTGVETSATAIAVSALTPESLARAQAWLAAQV